MQPLKDIIKTCAQSVYTSLGSGHSESIYHAAMEVELRLRGYRYSTKSPISIKYKSHTVGWCVADLILHTMPPDQDVIIELKATTYAPRSTEKAQLLGYLRTLDLPIGYLINFPQPTASRDVDQVDFIELFKESTNETGEKTGEKTGEVMTCDI